MEISALQKIVRDRYFKTDNDRGIYHTALWFHEEVGELSAAIASGDIQNSKEDLGDVEVDPQYIFFVMVEAYHCAQD